MPDARAADVPQLEVRRLIRAPRAAVFDAWVRPSSIRHWFATPGAPVRTVEVERRVGGRLLIEADVRGGTWMLDGRITELAEPSRLAFSWITTDCPAEVGSRVTVDFVERAEGTEIVLVQAGFPSEAKRRDNDGGWTELVGQVDELLRDQPGLRSVVRRVIAAPPEAVWRAWTTPAIMARFLSPRAEGADVTADVRVGGRFAITMVGEHGERYPHDGEYLEVDPPRRLKFTWRSAWSPPWVRPTVTLDLAPAGDGETELVLVHEGQLDEPTRASHEEGWAAFVTLLAGLAKAGVIAAGVATAAAELRKAPRP